MTLNIAIAGAAGRMGRMLINVVNDRGGDLRLSGALEHNGFEQLGADAGGLAGGGDLDVAITADRAQAFAGADVIIDFTLPQVQPKKGPGPQKRGRRLAKLFKQSINVPSPSSQD